MRSSFLTLLALGLGFSSVSQAAVACHGPCGTTKVASSSSTKVPSKTSTSSLAPPTHTATSRCKSTSHWPGFKKLKYAFIFGDSYTATGFDQKGVQPTPTNPLGNPTYPGYTSANGPNWVDFLTVKYNASLLLTYNLAYGGATIDSSLVAPYLPIVSSVAEQIENEWFPTYASKPAFAPWSSDDTIFALFDGINDVGNSWWLDTKTLNAAIFAVFHGLVDELYYAGARNFAFLTVPPVERSPLVLANPVDAQELEKADILAWNKLLNDMAKHMKALFPDVNIFLVDTYELFNEVLDNPASHPQTALYQNTTGYCFAYQNGTPAPDTYLPGCGIPVNQYLWLNSLHPTYPIHDVLGQAVAAQLRAGPNIC